MENDGTNLEDLVWFMDTTSSRQTPTDNLYSSRQKAKTDHGISLGNISDCKSLETLLFQLGYNGNIPDLQPDNPLITDFEATRGSILNSIEDSPDHKSPSEKVLQQTYFDTLKEFNGKMLENTSNGVLGGKPASDFRSLNFCTPDESSERPDLTLRLKFDGDVDIPRVTTSSKNTTTTKTTNIQLKPYRLAPWFVIAYLELKKWDVNIEDEVGQALYYAEQTFLCSPVRNYCLTALYNFKSIIFGGVIWKKNKMKYITTRLNDIDPSLQLAKFLSLPHEAFGFVEYFPLSRWTPVSALGRGSTSICVSITKNDDPHPNVGDKKKEYALKTSTDLEALEVERRILRYLHDENLKNNLNNTNITLAIPFVVDIELPASATTTSSTSSSTSTTTSSLTHPLRPFLNSMTLFLDVYERRRPSDFTLPQYLELWSILHFAHRNGICHRDVRYPNIRVKDGKVCLLDWSSAKPFRIIPNLSELGEGFYRRGSTCTASMKVLQHMETTRDGNYACYPSDEAISMILLLYQRCTKNKKLFMALDPEVAIDCWESETMPSEFRESINSISTFSERFESSDLDQLNELVTRTLEMLFPLTEESEQEKEHKEQKQRESELNEQMTQMTESTRTLLLQEASKTNEEEKNEPTKKKKSSATKKKPVEEKDEKEEENQGLIRAELRGKSTNSADDGIASRTRSKNKQRNSEEDRRG